ncbi:family 8 glycosyltransferase [Colletotrichum acutatum]|uniref:Family 8 glycosyltransferase n=1 Tax=Glomerella acutata TaxID=27357 RepID=A0AAD8X7Q5_GLOAC|nr:family 8 glycosyltransferase [Colletotrichum acutatum]KAK1702253.1 family 8 glycosyltransferase [Colletotrichum acutatum]
MSQAKRAVQSDKVWASLITNMCYLPGLLTLHHSLLASNTKYPFIALYTDCFPEEGRAAIAARGIPLHRVSRLSPSNTRDYSSEPRFADTWTKLTVFSLTAYNRVVLLDCDMLVRKNMDELMLLPLNPADTTITTGTKVFAAGHACTCNPLKKPHYPTSWIPANCPFTSHHADPDAAQTNGKDLTQQPLGLLNSGLLVVVPSKGQYDAIVDCVKTAPAEWVFPDQDLLANLFRGRWVGLPYVYNALKTLRWSGVHHAIWRDEEVKNIHYILSPKPWADREGDTSDHDESHHWWWAANRKRRAREEASGIADEY